MFMVILFSGKGPYFIKKKIVNLLLVCGGKIAYLVLAKIKITQCME